MHLAFPGAPTASFCPALCWPLPDGGAAHQGALPSRLGREAQDAAGPRACRPRAPLATQALIGPPPDLLTLGPFNT